MDLQDRNCSYWKEKKNKGLAFIFLRCRIFIRRTNGSRLSAIVTSDSICFYWNGWMEIDRSSWQNKLCPVRTNHVKEKVKLILKSQHEPINKMNLQREIRICSYWKENNNLITAYKPLSWNLCHVEPPFQTWNFLLVPSTYFSRWT